MTLLDVEKDIRELLEQRFKTRGEKDFYFKSSKISRDLPHEPRVIGRVLTTKIAPTGMIMIWSRGVGTRTAVWKTCFNGD